jgi:hypothetical protein
MMQTKVKHPLQWAVNGVCYVTFVWVFIGRSTG